MAVSLTCECGARLQIDDKFAGQTVFCPDCQRALKAPKTEPAPARTSGFALASIVLALVGAFTILGTVAAVILGIVALAQISRQGERLSGKRYAIAGIALGVVMTASTVFALSSIELMGLPNLVSDLQWKGKLDFGGPLEVVHEETNGGGFSIKRPSERWGVYKPAGLGPNALPDRHTAAELLLVEPGDDIVVLCFAERVSNNSSIYTCLDMAQKKVQDRYYEGLFSKSTKDLRGTVTAEGAVKALPKTADNVLAAERVVVKRVGNEEKMLLLRVYKKENDEMMYVVVGGTRKGNFARLEPKMREAMDSFKILNPLPNR